MATDSSILAWRILPGLERSSKFPINLLSSFVPSESTSQAAEPCSSTGRQFQEKDAVDATSRTGGSGEQISRANTSTQRSCTELRPLGSMMPVGCPGSRLGSSAAHQQENCSFRQSLIQRCLLVSLFLLPTQKIKS